MSKGIFSLGNSSGSAFASTTTPAIKPIIPEEKKESDKPKIEAVLAQVGKDSKEPSPVLTKVKLF